MLQTLIFSMFASFSMYDIQRLADEICLTETTCILCDDISCSATIQGRQVPRNDTEVCIGGVCAKCWISSGGYGCQIGTDCRDTIDSCENQCSGGVTPSTGPWGGCS